MRPACGKSTQNTCGGYSEDTQIRTLRRVFACLAASITITLREVMVGLGVTRLEVHSRRGLTSASSSGQLSPA
jgi:hypothetical protein